MIETSSNEGLSCFSDTLNKEPYLGGVLGRFGYWQPECQDIQGHRFTIPVALFYSRDEVKRPTINIEVAVTIELIESIKASTMLAWRPVTNDW